MTENSNFNIVREKLRLVKRLKDLRVERLADLFDIAVQQACYITSSSHSFLFQYHADSDELQMVAGYDSSGQEITMQPFSYQSHPVLGPVCKAEMPTVINSFSAAEKKELRPLAPFLEPERLIGMPLWERGEFKMVLLMFNKDEPYTEDDELSIHVLLEAVFFLHERRQAEQHYRIERDRMDNSLDALNIGLWDWNIKDDDLFFNRQIAEIIHTLHSDEFLKNFLTAVHPNDRFKIKMAFVRLLKTKNLFLQKEHRLWDGKKWRWQLSTARVLATDEFGRPARVIGTMASIDTVKKTQTDLAHSLRQEEIVSDIAQNFNSAKPFTEKMEYAVQAVGRHVDASHFFVFENDVAGEHTSMTYEWRKAGTQELKRKFVNLPVANYPSWWKLLKQHPLNQIYKGDSMGEDVRVVFDRYGIQAVLAMPLIVGGEYRGFLGFMETLTARRWSSADRNLLKTIQSIISNAFELEEMLQSQRKSEETIRSILKSIPDMLFTFTRDGVCTSAHVQTLPEEPIAKPEDMVNKNLKTIVPAYIFEKAMKAFELALETGASQFEFSIEKSYGTQSYEARISKVNDESVIALLRNITETKNYERQLKDAKKKAEEASRAKSQFLANVSHEIRTPLNAILGFSESLMDGITRKDQKKQLETIVASGKTLLSLINDILDLSKIEAGKLDIQPEPVSLGSVLGEIRQIFEQNAREKNLYFEVTVGSSVPPVVMLDEVRLRQILFNLAGNAVKFTHKGFVSIHVDAENVSNNDHIDLVVKVSDSGIGIPVSEQEKIFAAFNQQTGQSTRQYGGTGLGLAITKRLVEKMNGSIRVESEVGSGSTFIIKILKVESRQEAEYVQPEQCEERITSAFQGSTILFVDDVQYNIDVAEALLMRENLEIIYTNSAEEALEKIPESPPDLIFMDLKLRGMNGYEASRLIKQNPETRDIPIVAFSASILKEKIEKLGHLFDDYLLKPINRAELLRILKRFLPYEMVPASERQNVDRLDWPDDVLNNVPKNIAILKELYPHWLDVKTADVIFDIEEFVMELESSLENAQTPPVSKFINTLKNDLKLFDIVSIKKTLEDYPNLIRNLENVQNEMV